MYTQAPMSTKKKSFSNIVTNPSFTLPVNKESIFINFDKTVWFKGTTFLKKRKKYSVIHLLNNFCHHIKRPLLKNY